MNLALRFSWFEDLGSAVRAKGLRRELGEGRLHVLFYGWSGMGRYALYLFSLVDARGRVCAGDSGQGRQG